MLRQVWSQLEELRTQVVELRTEISELEATVAELAARVQRLGTIDVPWPISLLVLPAATVLAVLRQVQVLAGVAPSTPHSANCAATGSDRLAKPD